MRIQQATSTICCRSSRTRRWAPIVAAASTCGAMAPKPISSAMSAALWFERCRLGMWRRPCPSLRRQTRSLAPAARARIAAHTQRLPWLLGHRGVYVPGVWRRRRGRHAGAVRLVTLPLVMDLRYAHQDVLVDQRQALQTYRVMIMPSQILLFLYAILMFSLALMVRWEGVRRRKGPVLKAGDLQRQIGTSTIPYCPPRYRPKRAFDTTGR
jgi:hypothetical protein